MQQKSPELKEQYNVLSLHFLKKILDFIIGLFYLRKIYF
jgi:hypothetical protein